MQNQNETDAERRSDEKIRHLERALARAREELAELRTRYLEIVESRSWRLTMPLRRAMTLLRRMPLVPEPSAENTREAALDVGIEALPHSMRILPGDDLESANATCRLIGLSPGLEGVVSERARAVLEDTEASGSDLYLGWRQGPQRIAFIGSHELRCELAFDAQVCEIPEDGWKAALPPDRYAFLLVETVWEAHNRQWRYVLARDGGKRAVVEALVAHCRSISLPVVVWLRETRAHYAQFAWLAELADRTYVSDRELLECLQRDFPVRHAGWLAPAIQPALHNPLRSCRLANATRALEDRILFDGWWDLRGDTDEHARLKELTQRGLLVAESEWDFSNNRLGDFPEFRNFAIGCLGREEKLVASRLFGAEVFLGRPLAGGWRAERSMLQAAAAGGLVARLDGSPLPVSDLQLPDGNAAGQLEAMLSLLADPLQRAAWSHRVWRTLASQHTFAHRLQQIADELALPERFVPKQERIACLMVTMRPELLAGSIERFRRDAYPHKELVVIVNRDDCTPADFRGLLREGEPVRIHVAGRSRSLGACLNFAAAQTDAPLWAKIDDDDLYGPNYLSDIALHRRANPLKVFGKPPVFGYLESGDELLWDRLWAEQANLVHVSGHARAALVAGGTLGGERAVLDIVPFSERRRGGSDSGFVRRCYQHGIDVVAMDGFNFVRFRSAHAGFHTWNLSEDEVRERSVSVGSRDDVERVAFV